MTDQVARPAADLADQAAVPPASLLRHVAHLHLDGCRCKWQLRPRTGWVRLDTNPACRHHSRQARRAHLEETLREIIPQDWQGHSGSCQASAMVAEVHALLWGE